MALSVGLHAIGLGLVLAHAPGATWPGAPPDMMVDLVFAPTAATGGRAPRAAEPPPPLATAAARRAAPPRHLAVQSLAPSRPAPEQHSEVPTAAADQNSDKSADAASAATEARPAAGVPGNSLPAYPAAARRRDEQGTVLVRVMVGADGRPLSAGLERSSGHALLDDAAMRKIMEWRFVAATRGGAAVSGAALVRFVFQLEERGGDGTASSTTAIGR